MSQSILNDVGSQRILEMEQNLKPENVQNLENDQNRWAKLVQSEPKNEAVEMAKMIRYRARLWRHLANPNAFPKPTPICSLEDKVGKT